MSRVCARVFGGVFQCACVRVCVHARVRLCLMFLFVCTSNVHVCVECICFVCLYMFASARTRVISVFPDY